MTTTERVMKPPPQTSYRGVEDRVEVAFDEVCRLIELAYGVTKADLLSSSRKATIAWPRMFVYYVLREKYDLTLVDIGLLMGRDHSTVHHGWRRTGKLIQASKGERAMVEWLMDPYEE